MITNSLLATDKEKTKLNWFEYWIGHCWMTGWQSIRGSYRIWADLMTSNYKDYTLLHGDDPFTECYEWFWVSLNEDDTYPRSFLEHLMQLVDDVKTGKEKLIPFDNLDDLMKDLEEDQLNPDTMYLSNSESSFSQNIGPTPNFSHNKDD